MPQTVVGCGAGCATVQFVSESGVRCRGDVPRLEALGADAVLVGETLMRARIRAKAGRAAGYRMTRIKLCGMFPSPGRGDRQSSLPPVYRLCFAP